MDNTEEKIKMKDLLDAVIRLLEREDQLINSRVTWYLAIQGFIITGVALIFTGKFEYHQHLQTPAIRLLSFLGIAISFIVFISVYRARKAKRKIGCKWQNFSSTENKTSFFPDPRGDTSWLSFFTPGLWVPVILVAFWLIVIFNV